MNHARLPSHVQLPRRGWPRCSARSPLPVCLVTASVPRPGLLHFSTDCIQLRPETVDDDSLGMSTIYVFTLVSSLSRSQPSAVGFDDRLHQIAMRDPTDQSDFPDHLTWQMNMALDYSKVRHTTKEISPESPRTAAM